MRLRNTYNMSVLYSSKVPDAKGWYIFTLAFFLPINALPLVLLFIRTSIIPLHLLKSVSLSK